MTVSGLLKSRSVRRTDPRPRPRPRTTRELFNRDGLGVFARPDIDVQLAGPRDVIRQQLQRYHRQDHPAAAGRSAGCRPRPRRARRPAWLPTLATATMCAPRARTCGDVGEELGGEPIPSVATQTTGVSGPSRAIGPCFISPAAYASPWHMVGDLLELERALQGNRQPREPSQVEKERAPRRAGARSSRPPHPPRQPSRRSGPGDGPATRAAAPPHPGAIDSRAVARRRGKRQQEGAGPARRTSWSPRRPSPVRRA